MYFFLMLGFFIFFIGGVASNPSPYFGSVALMVSSVLGAGILANFSNTFVSLVLVLVYLGGMLVVFVYSIAMSSDVYPEAWGSRSVIFYVMSFVWCLFFLWWSMGGWFFDMSMFGNSILLDDEVIDLGGVVLLYSFGGGSFLILGVGLLLTLFVVLDLVSGWYFGSVSTI